jgi:chromosome segregation protein
MRLTELEITGFKSFADRTKLTFDHNITGIVGPNGCGKSNVIDAVRWVLGEQRTRYLRSDKMENILFNGTEARKKSSLAEVSITFENTRNLLPTEYTTVTLTRKYYRDGDGEYLLNNVPCRLKDIQDLLMDTGIGPDSYAIIELKMVDDLLNDKQGSRRLLFEEAAGIGKYKLRKKETFNRLDDTEQSLTRVLDLLHEIEQNLKSLEKQATRTRQYLKLKDSYREASTRVAVLRMRDLDATVRTLNQRRQESRERQSQLDATIARHEARLQELQTETTGLEQGLAAAQKKLNQHLEVIKKLENDKVVRNERLTYLRQRDENLRKQLQDLAEAAQKTDWEISTLLTQLEAAEAQQKEQGQKLSGLTQAQQASQEQLNSLRTAAESLGRQVREQERILQLSQKEVDMADVRLQGLRQELQRASQDTQQREADLNASQASRTPLETQVAELNEKATELRKRKTELEQTIQWETETLNTLKDQRYQVQRQLDSAKNEYDLTKSMVENLEGFPDSVRFLKKSGTWKANAVLLSDVFSCEDAFKVAIESYLEPWMNYYVVQDRSEALLGSEVLKNAAKGRANFFVLQDIEAQSKAFRPLLKDPIPMGLTPALSVIDYPRQYQNLALLLFGSVYLTDGNPQQVEEAFQVASKSVEATTLGDAELGEMAALTILQKAGNYSKRSFSSNGGSVGLFTGKKIGRARNLEKLGKDIEQLQKSLEDLQAQLKQHTEALQKAQIELPTRALEETTRQLNTKQNELNALDVKLEQYRSMILDIGVRQAEITAEIVRNEQIKAEAQPKLDAQQKDLKALQEQLLAAETHLRTSAEGFSEGTRVLNQENITLVNLTNQLRGLEKDLANSRRTQDERRGTESRLRDEFKGVKTEIEKLENTHVAGEDEIAGLYEQRQQMERGVEIEEEKLRQLRAAIQHNENLAREARRDKDQLIQQNESLREQFSELEIKRNAINDRLLVEFQLAFADINAEEVFPEGSTVPALEDAEPEMIAQRERLQKFGEINPTAIEAYNELKERYDFIVAQRDDLLNAKKDLLATIAELDRTASEQFMTTFSAIRENFQKVFRALFSEHDTADLELARGDDPLESPIDIIAKPKGKRPLSISQLSSGEKTLTAISLLFAIYLIKPAPFCIFDEVDAPLDDANIDKFNRIIQQFSGQSQFILVTHNKRTMSHTQVMYGVTMEEAGVSRLLPVNLETLGLK